MPESGPAVKGSFPIMMGWPGSPCAGTDWTRAVAFAIVQAWQLPGRRKKRLPWVCLFFIFTTTRLLTNRYEQNRVVRGTTSELGDPMPLRMRVHDREPIGA